MSLMFPKPVLRDKDDLRRTCRQCGKAFTKNSLSATLCRECADTKRAKRQKRRSTLRKASRRLRGRNNSLNDRDEQGKELLGYKHPRSFVRTDGSEVLYGIDWEKRVEEIAIRSGGICEVPLENGVGCGEEPVDPHHLKRRSKGRDDRASNLAFVSRSCHRLLDGRNPKFGEHDDQDGI